MDRWMDNKPEEQNEGLANYYRTFGLEIGCFVMHGASTFSNETAS